MLFCTSSDRLYVLDAVAKCTAFLSLFKRVTVWFLEELFNDKKNLTKLEAMG